MDTEAFPLQFNTEAQCLDYLFHLRWEHGYLCPKCRHNEMWEVRSHKYKCKKCGYQTTVIAGTLFQDSHIPITMWFHAAWYFSKFWPKVTVCNLKDELQLNSRRTAYNIYHKLEYAAAQPRSFLSKLDGPIEVALYCDRPCLAVAVEVRNTISGRIRAIERSPDTSSTINDFIESVVEPGSEIIYTSNVDGSRLVDCGYIGIKKKDVYSLPFARGAYYKFVNTLDLSMPINEQIDAYCMELNSKKSPISFEELLTNATHMPPYPYKPKSFK